MYETAAGSVNSGAGLEGPSSEGVERPPRGQPRPGPANHAGAPRFLGAGLLRGAPIVARRQQSDGRVRSPEPRGAHRLEAQRTVTWPLVIGFSGRLGAAVHRVATPMKEKLIWSGGSFADFPLSWTRVMHGKPVTSTPPTLP